jgi:mannose-6-phosphate isomerase-like protein (cupin superfamily)
MTTGYAIHERDLTAVREPDDTATVRLTIDQTAGAEELVQRVIHFRRGRSRPRTVQGRDEIAFVVSGTGTLDLDGVRHPLDSDTGFYIRAGESYEIDNDGDADLVVVSVTAPEPTEGEQRSERKVTVRFADQKILPAGKDREFRFVIDPAAGCRDVTQFVGLIPPGRAPTHYHLYDEVIYVLDGEGVLHIEGRDDTPIEAGTCIYLPPPTQHCLENTGPTPLRVLGVFHPAGDASEAYEDSE